MPPRGRGPGLHLLRLRRQSLGLHLGEGGIEGRALEAGGALGDVSALEDPEAVLAGGVPHRDRLAGLVDVAVLAHPLAVSGGLLPVDGAILLGVGGSEPANMDLKSQRIQSGLSPSISSIEPLLLEDLRLLRLDELGKGGRSEAGRKNLEGSL